MEPGTGYQLGGMKVVWEKGYRSSEKLGCRQRTEREGGGETGRGETEPRDGD